MAKAYHRGEILQKYFSLGYSCSSETFLTCEEAEDEHKRREWAVRKDKFVPMEGEKFYHTDIVGNVGLAFRTREDCQDAIDNHDLIRLFYQIR